MNVIDSDQVQLKLLGIKSIIYFTPERFEHLESNPSYSCTHYQVKEPEHPQIDFDLIVSQILTEKENLEKTPILLFCVSGMISAAACLRLLLETNKAWPKEIATAYIMNKRYETKDFPAWLYSQVNRSDPKKMKSEPLELPDESKA